MIKLNILKFILFLPHIKMFCGNGSKCVCIETNNYDEYRAIRDMMGKEPIRKLPEPMKFSIGNMYCSNYFKCTCCHKWFEIYDDIDENYMCISCKNKGS